jgi:1,2-dihydroxy-3-keto-5-methylthiopentene dioxygenase
MVSAWFMNDEDSEDQRSEHHKEPPQFVDLKTLSKLTGVLHWSINADNYEKDPVLAQVRSERGYSYQDEITCSREKLPDYETKLRNFYTEHIHSDEEIRCVLEGKGYFDVRDAEDRWIRIRVEKGDLIVLPAGIYHRFTLDKSDYIRVLRLFVGEPVWTPINRPADDHPARSSYLQSLSASSYG